KPSSPGSWLDIIAVQAGVVIGGLVLRRCAGAPREIRPRMVGSSSRHRSKTSAGAAESRPTISSFENFMLASRDVRCIGVALRSQTGAVSGAPARQPDEIADVVAVDQHDLREPVS